MTDCEVLVCGLGPVGQLLANLLGGLGVSTIAVEAAPGPYDLPRAATIDDEVLRILQSAGLHEQVLAEAQVQRRVSFATAGGRELEVLRTENGSLGHPPLVSIHQPSMERTLLQGLQRFTCVETRFAHRLEALDRRADHVIGWTRPGAGGRRTAIRARFLVGCDGARSAVRSRLGIDFGGSTFAQPWLVVDALVDRPVARVPHPCFVGDPLRPAVTLPMSPGRHRWEFLLHPGEEHAAFVKPDRVRELIAPWTSCERVEIERAVVYTFHARRAARWRAGRVLLAGDAAHVMPPFAGQGFSSGARDAENLAWKLDAVLRGAPERLLDSYERERRPHVTAMANLAVRWGGIVQTTNPRVARRRDRVLAAVAGSSLGRELQDRIKPVPVHRAGAYAHVPERLPWRRSAGELFPQPEVRTATGPVALDDALGRGWAILARDDRAAGGLRDAGIRVLALGADLADTSGVVGAWLDRRGADWVLLRPDRFVFACGRRGSTGEALSALRRLVAPGVRSEAPDLMAVAA